MRRSTCSFSTLVYHALAVGISVCLVGVVASARTVSIPPDPEPSRAELPKIEPAAVEASPYVEIGEPAGFLSLLVNRNRMVVRRGPTSKSRRRGVVMKGSRLPAIERTRGKGCRDYWYRVHDEAWVCGSGVTPTDDFAEGLHYPVMEDGELTPWPYAFVHKPAMEYRNAGGGVEEVREVFKGYGFGVKGVTRLYGEVYFKTVEGRLVPRSAAGISRRVSDFEGVEIIDGSPWPVGWVNSRKAWAYSEPSRKKKFRIAPVERYSPFEVLEETGKGRRRFVRYDEGTWLDRKDVRVVTEASRPDSVGPAEKWIDVDISQQIVTAYEGDTPVYATMVSSGRGGGSRTVKGKFRIWVKVSAIPMDNTDEELDEEIEEGIDGGVPDEDRHLFSLHDVPWSQFFFENFALHGVYWHDRFGNRRSHGCVNLAPTDARWFFDWTGPRLPDGWWAIYASEGDLGTLVRVR